jgi:hypothetical protein
MLTVRTKPVGFCLMPMLLFVGIASLSGCRQPPPIPKEGDVVIWSNKWNKDSELIIKAKLGQRREHVIVDARTDHLSYEPEYERFIGQFPIDYDPKPYPTFTEQERIAYETAKRNKKLPPYKSLHPIQFNLMLNGVKAKATDRSIVSEQALDNINQVRVELGGQGNSADTNYTTKERHDRFVKSKVNKTWQIDQQSSDEYGMKCYRKNDEGPLSNSFCFGASTYAKASGVFFTISANNWVHARSYEPIYGGIKVEYRIDRRKLKHWKEVDAAIWRLLERWNISPIATPIQD